MKLRLLVLSGEFFLFLFVTSLGTAFFFLFVLQYTTRVDKFMKLI